ncbi:BED zinc finger [Ancylostoma caninum]|uniref:BED zinc finger n=1 Tax=Ancylostoma caninum TaxID=29170 RepID=A0A368GP58_ANCCA|nr:BED zinc finger [Ancylostoma caninum]
MSSVWKFYKRAVEGEDRREYATCKFCTKSFKIPRSKTTSNLLSHLNKCHKSEMEQSSEDNQNGTDTGVSQQKLEDVFKRKLNSRVKHTLDRKLVTFIAKSAVPLNIAAEDYFKDFISELNPGYTVPCPKTLLSLMKAEVESIDETNKKIFCKGGVQIAITADGWSSKNSSSSLLAVTGHALSADFSVRKDVILDVIPMEEESKTAAVVADKIRECLARLDIPPNSISFLIADGATVMSRAAFELDIEYMHCCAHIVNLAVRASLELDTVREPLKIVKRVAAKLNRSGKLKNMFKRFLKEESLQMTLPMTDSPTRWSSTYYMICDFLNTLPAVEKLLEFLRCSPLEDNEIRLLKAIRVFLEPFQTMTKQVCYQSACISMYIPVGKALITTTEGNLENARKEAAAFGECLLLKTKAYFEEFFENRSLQFATLCDARFAYLETVFTKEKWNEISDDFINCRCT